jgi:glycosyltransferase involved in cell wall biosynthesis
VKIAIVTDAWLPQVNGVVMSLRQTGEYLSAFGHSVTFITPSDFDTFPCPTYPEIRLAWRPGARLRRRLDALQPDALHIATEGPLGFAARAHALRRAMAFTTSWHTQFPEYLRRRAPVPRRFSYALLRWFHSAAVHCMVSTPAVEARLRGRGFERIVRWQRGVDTDLFRPRPKDFLDLPRPIAVYVGRLAVEKNVEAFLAMPWTGSRLVIGDGPDRQRLERMFPSARFAGFLSGESLACHLAAADVMVFPSLTDTFGLVNLEAMACGVPVAAYPVEGPIDVIRDGVSGRLDVDLGRAAREALMLDPAACREQALQWSWEACSREFEANLVNNGAARGLPVPG